MTGTELLLVSLAALFIGSADLFGGMAARCHPPLAVAAWSQAIGVPIVLVAAILVPGDPIGRDLAIGGLAGLGSAVGVSALYLGFAKGSVGIVAPTAATTAAAIPILVGLASGDRPTSLVAVGLVIGVTAIVLVGFVPGERRRSSLGLALGILSGLGFGGMVIAYAGTSADSGVWSVVTGRTVAALTAAVALAALSIDWRLVGEARRESALAGVLGALGLGAFVAASQTADLIVLGVTLGLFPAVTVGLAAVVLREPMRATQWSGLALAVVAVTLISVG